MLVSIVTRRGIRYIHFHSVSLFWKRCSKNTCDVALVNSRTTWRKVYTFPFDLFIWKHFSKNTCEVVLESLREAYESITLYYYTYLKETQIKLNQTKTALLLQKATQKYWKLTDYWIINRLLPFSLFTVTCAYFSFLNSRVFSYLGHSTPRIIKVTSDHSCRI